MTRAILAVVGAVLLFGLAACPASPPCSAGDLAPGGVMFLHGAECRARVEACTDGECKALVRDECNRWGDARCGFSVDGGEAGAP